MSAAAAGGHPEPVEPSLELLGRFEIDLDPPHLLGETQWGERRIVPIAGGRFHGPHLQGVVVPGGADWQVVHADGSATVDTRYTLQTHDGALIYISTRGTRRGPTEVLERLGRGEAVDPRHYYFRVTAWYETGDERYAWLNGLVAVASAVRQRDAVVYDAYAVR